MIQKGTIDKINPSEWGFLKDVFINLRSLQVEKCIKQQELKDRTNDADRYGRDARQCKSEYFTSSLTPIRKDLETTTTDAALFESVVV